MNNENTPEIAINPQFDRLVQPMSELDQIKLYQELSVSSEVPIIRTWHQTHLEDRYLYQFCISHNIPFSTTELYFEDQVAAALYICSTQLSKENLTAEYRKYLIGQKFLLMLAASDESKLPDSKYRIAAVIAHDLKISTGTVMKYSTFAKGINAIFDQSMEFAQRILLGKTKVSIENTLELSRLMPDEIKAIAASVIADSRDHITLSYIRNEVKWSHIHEQAPLSRREQKEQRLSTHAAIRQMPQYDPDSEVNSLCMTIDSWISSMQRVHNSANFQKITNKARFQLMKKLSFLEHTVNVIQESLEERNSV